MKRISKYQVTLQNEFKYNVDTFENHKNMPLSYSSPFQLLHLNSSKFLACNFLESKHEKENYEIALEEYPSDSTLFSIIPAFKYQKDSSLVRLNCLTHIFLHTARAFSLDDQRRRLRVDCSIDTFQ